MSNQKISKEEEKKLRDAFKLMDRDNGGTISKSELKKFYKSLGIKFDQKDLDKAFEEVDTDGTGDIDFEEFCRFTKISGIAVDGSDKSKNKPVLRAKKNTEKKVIEEEFDEDALKISEEIAKLRKKPSSVIEKMDDSKKVKNDQLKLNGELDDFCKQCLDSLNKSKDPLHVEITSKQFGELVSQNAESVEGPIKNFIYFGNYDNPQELLQKIILREDEVDDNVANHFTNPDYKCLGIAFLKPSQKDRQSMTMISFVTDYVSKQKEE